MSYVVRLQMCLFNIEALKDMQHNCIKPRIQEIKKIHRRERTRNRGRKNAAKFLTQLPIKWIRHRSSETIESNGTIITAGRKSVS